MDLDTRHAAILETIGWISPELQELAIVLDRFPAMRKAGIQPWVEKLRRHWPDSLATSASITASITASIATIESAFDASNGVQTPFGHRWGGDVFSLSHSHIESIRQGQTLALDVMGEYVVFSKTEEGKEDV